MMVGFFNTDKKILSHVEKMISEGVDIIDVGGYSSKPGAKTSERGAKKSYSLYNINKKKLSRNTNIYRYIQINSCPKRVENGANIINDISSGDLDEKMYDVVSNLNVPYVMMHMQGKPADMQVKPTYKNVGIRCCKNSFKKNCFSKK